MVHHIHKRMCVITHAHRNFLNNLCIESNLQTAVRVPTADTCIVFNVNTKEEVHQTQPITTPICAAIRSPLSFVIGSTAALLMSVVRKNTSSKLHQSWLKVTDQATVSFFFFFLYFLCILVKLGVNEELHGWRDRKQTRKCDLQKSWSHFLVHLVS